MIETSFDDFWKGMNSARGIERIEQWSGKCRDKASDLTVSAFLKLAGLVSYGIRTSSRYRVRANVSAGLLLVSRVIGMWIVGRVSHRKAGPETRSGKMVSSST